MKGSAVRIRASASTKSLQTKGFGARHNSRAVSQGATSRATRASGAPLRPRLLPHLLATPGGVCEHSRRRRFRPGALVMVAGVVSEFDPGASRMWTPHARRGLLGESRSGSSNLDNRRKPLARPRCARARQWRRRTRCRQRQRRGSPGDCGSRWAWRACCGCGSQQRACRRGAPPSVERAEQRRVRRRRRPGGRVAAWEPDWGLTFISSSDQRASAAVADRVERETHNPRVGRNLATLFERAGLSNISVVARIGLWETLDVVERLRPTEAVTNWSQTES